MHAINVEMKALAEFAIKSARDRYKFMLDYSENSIYSLDKILEKIYWGFSIYTPDEKKSGLVSETAKIWGSYLGEYMRRKWGGEWIEKGSTQLVLINNIELSPINLVYQKITNNPNSSIMDYINKTQGVMYRIAIDPNQAKSVTKKISPAIKAAAVARSNLPLKLDKRIMYILAGVGGLSIVILAFVIISIFRRAGSLPTSAINPSATSTNTVLVALDTATPSPTTTPSSTMTTFPTYTQKPTKTPRPSATATPSPSLTPTNTLTPTITQTLYIWKPPTPTRTATRTEPPPPPISTPTQNPTQTPSPTSAPPTEPPPQIESCDVSPSTVPAGNNTSITFTVRFSAAGYGFSAITPPIPPGWPQQEGCDGIDNDNDGVASCDGYSGMLPNSTSVDVIIETSLGNCSVSYSSQ